MKFKTTKKAVMEGYNAVISVGYCGFQNLLFRRDPVAYTAGIYGWNADIYDLGGGVALVTGYRPFGNVNHTSGMYADFEERAKNARYNCGGDELDQKLDELIKEFVEVVASNEKAVN